MSIDWQNLGLFAAASLALVLTPGPNPLYVMTRGIAQGRKAALISALGASSGDLVYALFAALGLAVILQQSAAVYGIIKVCGAIYMLLIGIQSLSGKTSLPAAAEPVMAEPPRRLFLKGFFVSALNPKTAIFFISFFPQFIDSGSESAAASMLLYGMIFFLLGLAALILYAQASGFIGRRLAARQRWQQCFQRAAGALFIGLGIRLLAPEQR